MNDEEETRAEEAISAGQTAKRSASRSSAATKKQRNAQTSKRTAGAGLVSEAKMMKAKNKSLDLQTVSSGAYQVLVSELAESAQVPLYMDVDVHGASTAQPSTAADRARPSAASSAAMEEGHDDEIIVDDVVDQFERAAPAGVRVVNSMWEVTGRESFNTVVSHGSNFWVGDTNANRAQYPRSTNLPCMSCKFDISKTPLMRCNEMDAKFGVFSGAYGQWHAACLKTLVRATNPFWMEEMVILNAFGVQIAGIDMSTVGFAPDLMRLRTINPMGDLSDEAFLEIVEGGQIDDHRLITNALWVPKPIFFATMNYNEQRARNARNLLSSKFIDATDEEVARLASSLPSHLCPSMFDPSIVIDTQTGKWVDHHLLNDATSSTSTKMSLIPKITISPWTVPGYMSSSASDACDSDPVTTRVPHAHRVGDMTS